MTGVKIDPRTVAHPFTLPDGTPVILKHITHKDFEELDVWVRQQFMKNAADATRYMNVVEKQEFMIAALAHAAKLTFQYGDGRDILYGSAYGMARLMYQMIQNPPMSFEQFKTMLYPEGFVTPEGTDLLGKMLSLTNTGEIQPDIDTLVEKIMELNATQEDGTINEIASDMIRQSIDGERDNSMSAMLQEARNRQSERDRLVEETQQLADELVTLTKQTG